MHSDVIHFSFSESEEIKLGAPVEDLLACHASSSHVTLFRIISLCFPFNKGDLAVIGSAHGQAERRRFHIGPHLSLTLGWRWGVS